MEKQKKVCKKEQILTERIYNLKMSLQVLEKAGLSFFHNEAKQLVRNKITELKTL